MPSTKVPAAAPATALVRELAEILNETGLSEIEVERDGLRVRVARSLISTPVQVATAPAPLVPAMVPPAAPIAEREAVRTGDTVTSPMVGTVYLQSQPGAPPFVGVGDTVAAGQTLLLVEAMKTMNPITAPRAGSVLEVLVADGQPVEFGEPLVVIG
jgi:acetyl-CoA carboxylase biotin carboxyl carrier protein